MQVDSLQLSVVVPTLNEACAIGATLDHIRRIPGVCQIVVIDGGSDDSTAAIARQHGALVLRSPRGRGTQLHTGARQASGNVLWFLHADTHPPLDAAAQIAGALAEPRVIGGHFRVRFDRPDAASRFFTILYTLAQCFGLRYGDSGYFVKREAYERSGGFRPVPLFEDLDLLRRLGRYGRFVRTSGWVITSSRRFEGRSAVLTLARWTLLQLLYWAGVPPPLLGSFYAAIRGPGRPRQG